MSGDKELDAVIDELAMRQAETLKVVKAGFHALSAARAEVERLTKANADQCESCEELSIRREEVVDLGARLECVHAILGGGVRSPEQAARELVAEVARLRPMEAARDAWFRWLLTDGEHQAHIPDAAVILDNIKLGLGPDGRAVKL